MKILITLIAVATFSIGCHYFFTKPPIAYDSKYSIVGSWKIDSVYNIKSPGCAEEVLTKFDFDSLIAYKFNDDSTLQTIYKNTTTTYHYILKNDSLMSNGNIDFIATIIFLNDTIFTFTTSHYTTSRFKRINNK